VSLNPSFAPAAASRRARAWAAASAGLCFSLLAAAEPAIYLLGEIHDNPEGHALRLEKIADIVRSAPQPVIAMEQFDREKQAALSAAQQECPDAACVIAKAGGKGWDWDFYKPVIDLALRQRIPLLAANVSPQDARLVVRDGLGAALSAKLRDAYGLNAGVPPEVDAIQREAVFQGHCRMAPKAALGGMVSAQVARDVWMAHVLREHPQSTVLLLAGNGHVRKDAGVYHWLSSAERQRTQVHAYLEAPDAQDAARFDQIHPIAAVKREDPCAAFRAAPGNAARP
jgi:uncharacterized iron-regulated protein